MMTKKKEEGIHDRCPLSKVSKCCWVCCARIKNPSITIDPGAIRMNFYTKSIGTFPMTERHDEHEFYFCSLQCFMKYLFKQMVKKTFAYHADTPFYKKLLRCAKHIF